jgi:hypothetical protein
MSDVYEWLEVLGRGFSGVCRKVRFKENGQIYVIKQVDVSFVTKDEYTTALQEAELLSSLCHPNVIRSLQSHNMLCVCVQPVAALPLQLTLAWQIF